MKVKTLSLGNMDNNCYIVYDETTRDAAIIDAPTDAAKILSAIVDNQLACNYILLTHAHYDHIGALDELKNATGAQVCIHESEALALNDSTANLARYSGAKCPVSPADMLLRDGDVVQFGFVNTLVLNTPGHTVGGLCFYCTDTTPCENSIITKPALFSGDTLFHKDIGRCDFPGGSYATIKQSIRRKLYTLPDETIVYPGHGRSTSIAYEKQHNNYIRQDWEYEY